MERDTIHGQVMKMGKRKCCPSSLVLTMTLTPDSAVSLILYTAVTVTAPRPQYAVLTTDPVWLLGLSLFVGVLLNLVFELGLSMTLWAVLLSMTLKQQT